MQPPPTPEVQMREATLIKDRTIFTFLRVESSKSCPALPGRFFGVAAYCSAEKPPGFTFTLKLHSLLPFPSLEAKILRVSLVRSLLIFTNFHLWCWAFWSAA